MKKYDLSEDAAKLLEKGWSRDRILALSSSLVNNRQLWVGDANAMNTLRVEAIRSEARLYCYFCGLDLLRNGHCGAGCC